MAKFVAMVSAVAIASDLLFDCWSPAGSLKAEEAVRGEHCQGSESVSPGHTVTEGAFLWRPQTNLYSAARSSSTSALALQRRQLQQHHQLQRFESSLAAVGDGDKGPQSVSWTSRVTHSLAWLTAAAAKRFRGGTLSGGSSGMEASEPAAAVKEAADVDVLPLKSGAVNGKADRISSTGSSTIITREEAVATSPHGSGTTPPSHAHIVTDTSTIVDTSASRDKLELPHIANQKPPKQQQHQEDLVTDAPEERLSSAESPTSKKPEKISDISFSSLFNSFDFELPKIFGFPGTLGVPLLVAALATGIVMGASMVLASSTLWGDTTFFRGQQQQMAQQFQQRLQDTVYAARQEEMVVLEEKVERDSLELLREAGLQDQLRQFSGLLSSLSTRLADLKSKVNLAAEAEAQIQVDPQEFDDLFAERLQLDMPQQAEKVVDTDKLRAEREEAETINLLEKILPLMKNFVDQEVKDLDVKQDQLSDMVTLSAQRLRALAGGDWELPAIPQTGETKGDGSGSDQWSLANIRLPRGVMEYISGVVSGSTGAMMLAVVAILSVPLVRKRQANAQQPTGKKGMWRSLWGNISGTVRGGFDVIRAKFKGEAEQLPPEVVSSLGGSRAQAPGAGENTLTEDNPAGSPQSASTQVALDGDALIEDFQRFDEFKDDYDAYSDFVDLVEKEVSQPAPPAQLPPLAVGAEEIRHDALLQAGTALRVYSRWEGEDSVEEWIPLLAVAIEGTVQAAFVRGLWAARNAPGVERALTAIVSRSVCARVQKRGWKELVTGAQTSTRTLNFGYEVLTSSGWRRSADEDISQRDIVHIPGSYIH